MMMTPTLILFWCSIIISIIFMLSSPSLFLAWVALEINTLAFIPFILSSLKNSGESALKYFLSQTLGSILFIYALISLGSFYSESFFGIIMISALLIKLGAAPFHAWMPMMVSSLSWETLFMLLTIQKLNPLILLFNLAPVPSLLIVAGLSSLLVGSLIGLIQVQIRSILTYSSINQVGWFCLALLNSGKLMFTYYLFYLIILFPIILLTKHLNLNLLSQLSAKKMGLPMQSLFFMNFLSLGGLPPFLGFLPKWLVLMELISQSQWILSFTLIFTSLVTLYFYLRLTFNSFLMSSTQWNTSTPTLNIPKFVILGTQINFLGLSCAFLI